MNPPKEFADEYWKMRDRMEWASAALGRGQDLANVRTVVEEFREFYVKWRPRIQEPALCAGLDKTNEQMERTVVRGLEKIFLAHLHEVIEARKDWCAGELLLKMTVNFIALMKAAPPHLRPELEKIHRETMKTEFEPEAHYRETEAEVEQEETKYRKALAGFEVDWPDRVNTAMRERLEKLDGAGANAWQAEVAAEIERLSQKA